MANVRKKFLMVEAKRLGVTGITGAWSPQRLRDAIKLRQVNYRGQGRIKQRRVVC